MNMKLASAAAAAVIALASFTGCSAPTGGDNGKLDIVCTIFPEYDWIRNITGDVDNVSITYLLQNGSDLHNYQPTADDMIKISTCDVFVYVGGESDQWVDDALKEAVNKDMKVIELMDVIGSGAKEEEVKEGMEAEEEEDEAEEEGPEYDEHIWLSLKNAQVLCSEIADTLCSADPQNTEKYRANLASYTEQLGALDTRYADMISSAKNDTLIFGDRFPFRYLTDDYGLDYYAAFVGCSAETEASFGTIAFLAQKMDELGCDTIFTIENSDASIARSVVENTRNKNAAIAVLDSAQSVTSDQVNSGTTYLSIMEKNYDVLKEALE